MSNHPLRFESVLEREFAHSMLKFLRSDALLKSQVEVKTLCGVFRLDFVVTCPPDYRIAFECDGKEFHDESRDEFRDAIIIGDVFVDSIYRLRGSDITYHIEDLIYIISLWNPELFSTRSHIVLGQLKSSEVTKVEKSIDLTATLAHIRYLVDSTGDKMPHGLWVERQYRSKTNSFIKTWRSGQYEFAQKQGGGKLEELYAAYYDDLLSRMK